VNLEANNTYSTVNQNKYVPLLRSWMLINWLNPAKYFIFRLLDSFFFPSQGSNLEFTIFKKSVFLVPCLHGTAHTLAGALFHECLIGSSLYVGSIYIYPWHFQAPQEYLDMYSDIENDDRKTYLGKSIGFCFCNSVHVCRYLITCSDGNCIGCRCGWTCFCTERKRPIRKYNNSLHRWCREPETHYLFSGLAISSHLPFSEWWGHYQRSQQFSTAR
jgi:hypothetical protein